MTKNYYNLLQKEEDGITQAYLWDGNVAGMADSAEPRYYLQDDLGSPIRLLDGSGELTESYGYDEFGQDLYGNQGIVQPFGYTGYQADRIAGTYFAQAREYVPELGRFAGQDTIKGFVLAPYTLNEYSYCWSKPFSLVDLNGKEPEQKTTPEVYTYNREDAIEYAKEWSNSMQGIHPALEAILGKAGIGRNKDYYSYSTNCANFVSQCLYAGGIKENEFWYSKEKKKGEAWDIAEAWRLAKNQHDYFADPENGFINGEVITITPEDDVETILNDQNIQKGDLMYFLDKEGNVEHATIISRIDEGEILFSGNTKRRYDYPLKEALESDSYMGVFIIRIKDELEDRGGKSIGEEKD